MLLNMLGGVVAGVWLAVLGDWKTIGTGVVGMIGGAMICSLLMLPGIVLALPAMRMWGSDSFLARIIAVPILLVGHSWTYIVMTAWAFGAFLVLLKGVPIDDKALPYLLWAYAVATTPWVFMLQKDVQAGNDHGSISVFFLQIACAALILGFWLEAFWLIIAFWIIMAISLLFGLVIMARLMYVEARQ